MRKNLDPQITFGTAPMSNIKFDIFYRYSIKANMNRLYIIVIAILCFAATPVAIAGDIIKHYDEHYNITGYTVIEGGRQTHYDRSWNLPDICPNRNFV